MNTKLLMTASAIILLVGGIVLTFMPQEILNFFGVEATKPLQILVQIIGALYFAFGMQNWMTKSNLMGGIYARPIVVSNLTHFLVAGLALIKGLISNPALPGIVWIIGIIYSIFAIFFGLLLQRNPGAVSKQGEI